VNCRDVVEQFGEYRDGSLPHSIQNAIDEHLCECPDCVAYMSTLAAVPAVLRAASSDACRTPEPFPEWLVQSTISRIHTSKWLGGLVMRRCTSATETDARPLPKVHDGRPMSQSMTSRMPQESTWPVRRLVGQKALVTGANSGIGRAIAIALGQAGADVVVNFKNDPAAAQGVIDEIAEFEADAIAIQADVSQEAEVQAMFRRAIEEFGTIDIVVNNAGLQQDSRIEDMTLQQWNTVLSVNLTGQFLCAREAVREFKRRGVVPEISRAAGKIICVSSVHEVIPWAGHVNYAASKGGVSLMMKTLAQELAPHRIRVNSVAPGAVRTPINREAWETPEAYQSLLRLIPSKRIGEPEDIARAVVWLASDEADYVQGATLFVDGGMTLYPGFESGG